MQQGLNKEMILAILNVMAKVTSKLQLTVPKAIAEQYKIRPGDELDWTPAGEAMRVVKRSRSKSGKEQSLTIEVRLRLFDQATARQNRRDAAYRKKHGAERPLSRGWTREDLYDRGLSR
jgi:bifunctional DNA-binding transcriptional regulator/antitoxin component of YhaV-PrlF toxin-antitoxin module